jgi:hypothetical protein
MGRGWGKLGPGIDGCDGGDVLLASNVHRRFGKKSQPIANAGLAKFPPVHLPPLQ